MNMLALSFRIVFYVRVYDEYDYPLLSEGLRISFWMVLFGKTIAHTDIKQDKELFKKKKTCNRIHNSHSIAFLVMSLPKG